MVFELLGFELCEDKALYTNNCYFLSARISSSISNSSDLYFELFQHALRNYSSFEALLFPLFEEKTVPFSVLILFLSLPDRIIQKTDKKLPQIVYFLIKHKFKIYLSSFLIRHFLTSSFTSTFKQEQLKILPVFSSDFDRFENIFQKRDCKALVQSYISFFSLISSKKTGLPVTLITDSNIRSFQFL